ncbi:hypothetical protein B0H13DRAFT_1911818 [Mycena leptocephala]|nr:hypothetical protein B0H13DRAFT_1911818 [Mycena leptocephala]
MDFVPTWSRFTLPRRGKICELDVDIAEALTDEYRIASRARNLAAIPLWETDSDSDGGEVSTEDDDNDGSSHSSSLCSTSWPPSDSDTETDLEDSEYIPAAPDYFCSGDGYPNSLMNRNQSLANIHEKRTDYPFKDPQRRKAWISRKHKVLALASIKASEHVDEGWKAVECWVYKTHSGTGYHNPYRAPLARSRMGNNFFRQLNVQNERVLPIHRETLSKKTLAFVKVGSAWDLRRSKLSFSSYT